MLVRQLVAGTPLRHYPERLGVDSRTSFGSSRHERGRHGAVRHDRVADRGRRGARSAPRGFDQGLALVPREERPRGLGAPSARSHASTGSAALASPRPRFTAARIRRRGRLRQPQRGQQGSPRSLSSRVRARRPRRRPRSQGTRTSRDGRRLRGWPHSPAEASASRSPVDALGRRPQRSSRASAWRRLDPGDCRSGGRDGERGAAGQSAHAVPMQGAGRGGAWRRCYERPQHRGGNGRIWVTGAAGGAAAECDSWRLAAGWSVDRRDRGVCADAV
jgi:hypothetical protein